MTEMFGEAWSPMSVPDLAPDDDDDRSVRFAHIIINAHPNFILTLLGYTYNRANPGSWSNYGLNYV